MKQYAILPILTILFFASCTEKVDIEASINQEVNNSPLSAKNVCLSQKTAFIEVCPYLELGTSDTVSYKENLKVCIDEIILHTITDNKEKNYMPSIDTRYGDIAGVVFWEDIPAGISHQPQVVLADSFMCSYMWGCEAEAEILYKVRMRDNDSSTGWSEWQSRVKSKFCVPHQDTHVINIPIAITMNAISFGATVGDDETVTTEVE